jgi:excisionase family DNA binding protein
MKVQDPIGRRGPVLLEPADVNAAAHAARVLRAALAGKLVGPSRIQLLMADPVERTVVLPSPAAALLADMLTQLANGNAVTLVPMHAELTTQEAADLLGVSRPYLIGLLESGAIPFRRVGNRRKVAVADLLAYRDDSDQRRRAALDELTQQAEDLGLDYGD